MRHVATRTLVLVLALVGLAAVQGCGKKSLPVYPVSGKVTVDGKPLTAGQVALIPASDAPNKDLSAATIDASGSYTIYTAGKAGAPKGKYRVTVNPSMVPTGDSKGPAFGFNRVFADANKSPLSIDVVESPAAGAYDLKLTK